MQARGYTKLFLDAVRVLEPVRDPYAQRRPITFHGVGRSIDGFGLARFIVSFAGDDTTFPAHILTLIRDGYEVRFEMVGRHEQVLATLPIIWVLWRPESAFRDGRHVVTDAGVLEVRQALARAPAPSIVVDGGHEVWAGWLLKTPLTDLSAGLDALREASRCLGGVEVMPFDELNVLSLPFAGVVRNWNNHDLARVEVIEACPSRRYDLGELLSALKEPRPCWTE